jgi:hypothetical protein
VAAVVVAAVVVAAVVVAAVVVAAVVVAAAQACAGAGNQASTVMSSAVRAPKAARAGNGAVRQRPVRSCMRIVLTPSLGGQPLAQARQ